MAEPTSTRPYLIRALHEWCSDNGYTPYVAVRVDERVRVPREYVKDGEIVLNVSMDATSGLTISNEAIEFKARFAGVARDIYIPVGRVLAIYARENGQGMAFPLEETTQEQGDAGESPVATPGPVVNLTGVPTSNAGSGDHPEPPRPPPTGGRPALKRVK